MSLHIIKNLRFITSLCALYFFLPIKLLCGMDMGLTQMLHHEMFNRSELII